MKKFKTIIMFLLLLTICSCGNKKYVGYWCNYSETATIVVLLNDNITAGQKMNIENAVNKYINLTSLNYISKEEYAKELGQDVNTIDIYANYYLTFNSMESIGTYVDELSKMPGVHEAKQSSAKSNITLYNLQKDNSYTFTNSDEANKADIEHGTYKVKKGVITFTKSDSNETRLLYIKSDHLCGDAECNTIYAQSNETCSSVN